VVEPEDDEEEQRRYQDDQLLQQEVLLQQVAHGRDGRVVLGQVETLDARKPVDDSHLDCGEEGREYEKKEVGGPLLLGLVGDVNVDGLLHLAELDADAGVETIALG